MLSAPLLLERVPVVGALVVRARSWALVRLWSTCSPRLPSAGAHFTAMSSTVKMSVAIGGMTGGDPRSPYAISGGMVSNALPPGFINCNPSVQPAITPESGKEIVSPRLYDESKIVPSIRVP